MKTLKQISGAFILSVLCISYNVCAQNQSAESLKPAINTVNYHNAIGLRAGETSGLTFKHFVDQTSAFEAILGIWPNAFGLTVLYEKHIPAFNLEGMNWYYGGGGHVSFEKRIYYQYDYEDKFFYRYRSVGNAGIGIDGILGLEYKIKAIPFAISLDMKPFIEANSGGIFISIDPGLGIKVTF